MNIIYDARRVKAYERLQELGRYAQKTEAFIEELWKALVADGELMQEFTYYLDSHSLLDSIQVEGYGLTDIYMWLLNQHNIMQDYGKNGPECDKEALVLDTFWTMVEFKKNPEVYRKRLSRDWGLDQF